MNEIYKNLGNGIIIDFPGINRKKMPLIPEISQNLQKIIECENLAFFDSVLKFKN